MIIELRRNAPPVVREHERLDRLHAIEVGAGPFMFSELCALDPGGDHVWLHVELLRAAAKAEVDDSTYGARFDRMISFAQSHGWLDADGTRVRAHIAR